MFSFFDDKPGQEALKPLISRVKKTVPKPRGPVLPGSNPERAGSGSSGSFSGTHNPSSSSASGTGKPGSSSSSSLKPRKPVLSRPGSSSSLSVRDREKDKAKSGSKTTPRSSPAPTPRKRKVESRVQSESESDSSGDDAFDVKIKKRIISRSTTAGAGGAGEDGMEEVRYGEWDLSVVDMRGEWGRGWCGFVGSDEVLRGGLKGWAGGGKAEGSLDKYVPYFPQEGFDKESMPSVELLYPATGCRETFVLLQPTSAREYSPISELRNALRTILNHYIPPSHQGIFGSLSDSLDLDITSSVPTPIAAPNTPLPPSLSTSTPPRNAASPGPSGPTESIGDSLRKALASNRRDGPGFVRAMRRFNEAFEEIQNDGTLRKWMESKSRSLSRTEWSSVVEAVHEQAYSRVVGPYSNDLEHHPKHPDEVLRAISGKEDAYGELRHSFVSKVIDHTGLGPESVFVDLGSGVGNCVMQVALEAGSRSYGFELLPVPAHCARLQLRETRRRWAMWGLKGNLGVDVFEGDFRVHPEVGKRLKEADVVLVNNEVFPPSLNSDLTNLFLDLKEGAKIISLKPFVPESFKMNESNCDSFAAIVKMTQHTYHRDWVSWKGDSGVYYQQVIDRKERLRFEEEMNGSRRRR